jgi:phosphoglycolate phosphatase
VRAPKCTPECGADVENFVLTDDLTHLRAALFDFDGTLADGFDAIAAALNHVRAGYALPPLPTGEVRRFVGYGLDQLLRALVPGGDVARDIPAYRAVYSRIMTAQTRLLPGAAELADLFRTAGVRLAVCSNKSLPFTAGLLRSLGVADRFDAVVGPEDVSHPKPAPDMLFVALQRLGATAAEAVYVGDMTVDVAAGKAAGLPVWAVATGSQTADVLAAAGPERLFADLPAVAAFCRGRLRRLI